MKLIAHRGASLECPENTIESLIYGAQLGAYAVECDVKRIKDGTYIIFHDADLKRFAGIDLKVNDLIYNEMSDYITKADKTFITFNDINKKYHEKTPVLLHISCNVDDDFVELLKNASFNYICGATKADSVSVLSELLPPERILGFIPSIEVIEDFVNNGSGIIRLWEQWLTYITPLDVKAQFPGTEVWIMANRHPIGMNGSEESLDYFESINADGVLLNDIAMGMKWLSLK